MNWTIFIDAYPFLLSYYLTHLVHCGSGVISKLNLDILIEKIYRIRRSLKNENDEQSLIGYGQTEITEILHPFRFLQIETLCPMLNNLIFEHFKIKSSTLVSEIEHFVKKLYSLKREGGVSFEYFIDHFSEFYDYTNFEFTGESISIIHSISGSIGSENASFFDYKTPLSLLDKSKKCFLEVDGHFYSFEDGLVLSRLCKYLEQILKTDTKHQIELNDIKSTWSEGAVRDLFEQILIGGKYYQNNYYFANKKSRFENDGIYFFNGVVFVIEVKAGKVTPDSVYENFNDVIESYREQVERGVKQCQRTFDYIQNSKLVTFYDDKNVPKLKIDKDEIKMIIPICVTFEEEKCYLPGFNIRNTNSAKQLPVTINFYDLLTVFNYLDNNVLIVKYLYERTLPVLEKRLHIDDELPLLGIFTKTSLNLSDFLAQPIDQDIPDKNIKEIYIDDSYYANDIELYYECNGPKANFNIHPRFLAILKETNKILDKNLLYICVKILGLSTSCLKDFCDQFQKSNNGGNFAPKAIGIVRKDSNKIEKIFVLMNRPSSAFVKNKSLGYLYNEFNSNKDLEVIVVAYVRGEDVSIHKYLKNDDALKKLEVQETSKELKPLICDYKLN